jgi:hypothetical protein
VVAGPISSFMRRIIDFVKSRLRQMPRGLEILTKLSILYAVIVLVFPILMFLSPGPGAQFGSNGPPNFEEFKQPGGILWLFILDIFAVANVYGLLHASRWSRPLILSCFVLLPIIGAVHHAAFSIPNCVYLVLTAGVLVWYLYFRQTVEDYYAGIYKPGPDPATWPVVVDPAFWEQVRRRRNLFFLVWICWPPVGLLLYGLCALLLGHEPPVAAMFTIFYAWGAFWFWTVWRLKQLRCPRCHQRAIVHPFFFMKHAECRHCGLKNVQA